MLGLNMLESPERITRHFDHTAAQFLQTGYRTRETAKPALPFLMFVQSLLFATR